MSVAERTQQDPGMTPVAEAANKAPRRKLPPVRKVANGWEVDTRCHKCGVDVVLFSDIEPRMPGLGFAAFVLCAPCQEAVELAEASAQTEAMLQKRIRDSQLPNAMRGMRWDILDDRGDRTKAIEAAQAWSTAIKPRGLCLFGDTGAGKTRIAATATWARLQRFPVRWVSVPVLMAQVGAGFGDEGRAEAVATIAGSGPLVLDDLDKVNPSEWSKQQLFAAIDARIAADSPLLITTNLPPSQLGERFGQPIVSRIVGACDVVSLHGEDRRLSLPGTA